MLFRLNDSGLDAVIHGAGVARMLERAGDVLADEVEARAPERTGEFAGSIERTNAERRPGGAVVTVHSTDFAAHLVEFGSINNPAYAPFRRGAAALGLRLRDGGGRR